ncbi:hypothetical protein GGS24DRAFT_261849 [Hypoxylon argillaceum]|nr:hypothetical protein GGS24DRAFT_261849 [Hypoxylon argillaceum]KAI1149573.1 hypothetical protein F4825DRAFT_48138 [Nemania diffusa]
MICLPIKSFTSRLQRLVGMKSKAAAAAANEKRNSHILHISAPFNFKHESISLPGLSEDDIAILREKAAASRLGIHHSNDGSHSPSAFGSPRKAPRAPPSPARTVTPAVLVIPGTPLSAEDNVI